jgi:deoxyribodipyrimidine photo-lyase
MSRTFLRARLKPLNQKGVCAGRFILYWMQQSQRAEFNHALEYAVTKGKRSWVALAGGFRPYKKLS